MPIVQKGEINATALVVPDVYVQIVPPQTQLLNGVPTNVLGLVGTAQWGPKNVPVTVSSMASYSRQFGSITTDANDLGTAAATAVLQGANNLRCVRVATGDVAATAKVDLDNTSNFGFEATSKYTGSLANKCKVKWSAGSASKASAVTYKVTVTMPGQIGEVFDNIAAGTDAADTWANAISAVNNGQNSLRGPSKLIVAAAAGSSEKATVSASDEVTLAGGVDGSTVTSTQLIGTASAKSGIYALSDKGVSVAFIAGHSTATDWGTIQSFAKEQGIYWILAGAASTDLSTLDTAKKDNGIDSAHCKLLAGDWVYYNDTVNGQVRLVSPAGYVAGRLANLSPEQSSLNKPLYGLVGTQKSYVGQFYSAAEIQSFAEAGIDLIANPSPGGNYYSCRVGHNSSTNPVTNGDNYSRLTNYIAVTLESGLGQYIGRLQSAKVRSQAKATLETFLSNMESAGQIGNASGTSPFQVVLDDSNNSASRVALGYMTADIQVTYLSVIEKFIINVEGGQSVQIVRADTASASVETATEEG